MTIANFAVVFNTRTLTTPDGQLRHVRSAAVSAVSDAGDKFSRTFTVEVAPSDKLTARLRVNDQLFRWLEELCS